MAAPIFSSTVLSDIGNGLGYIYITKPIASSGSPAADEIVTVLDNTADGVRKAKLYGVQASSLAVNRVSTGIYTIDAPTGVGSITSITSAFGVNLINTGSPISYTGATTAADLAQDIVDAVNSYSNGIPDEEFTAVRIDDVVYFFGSTNSTKQNGTITITSTGFLTYTENQELSGGSVNDFSFDEAHGYQFFLDADYASGSCCSGAGTATVADISKAIEITSYMVNIGLQSAIPTLEEQMADDSIVYDRRGALSFIKLTGEGGSDDDLSTIICQNPTDGDRIVLYSSTNTITVMDGVSNIILKTSTYDVITASIIELVFNASNNVWYELNRSNQVIGSTADFRAGGYGIFALEDFNTAAVATSGTINFEPGVSEKYQKLTGSSTLVGNLTYGFAGTPLDGDEFWLEYDASVTIGAFALSIFGITLTAEQALNGGLIFYARYLNGSWYPQVFPNLNDGNTYTFQAATEFYKDASVTAVKVEDTLKTEVLIIDVSFDTNRTGDYKVKLPYACTINEINAWATDTIEATDDADLNFKDASLSSMGSGSFIAGDTIGTGIGTITPSSNNIFAADEILTITTTKTTKGGNAKCSIKITKS